MENKLEMFQTSIHCGLNLVEHPVNLIGRWIYMKASFVFHRYNRFQIGLCVFLEPFL